MRFLSRFNQFFGFTPTESKVVLFLLITFVAGSAVKLYRVYFPESLSGRFDYSEQEKEFAQRSQRIDSLEKTAAQKNPKSARAGRGTSSFKLKESKGLRSGEPVDLNTASKEELMELPGVGEAVAERILIYREENGKFETVEELKNVKGIGDRKFEKIRPMVKVE